MMGLSGLRVKDDREASSAIASHCAFLNLAIGARASATTSYRACTSSPTRPHLLVGRRFRENRTHKFPVDQVGRRGVAPHNVAPGRVFFVVLEEKMILAVVEDGPVRVVEPALLRSYMIFGLLLVVELAGVFIMLLKIDAVPSVSDVNKRRSRMVGTLRARRRFLVLFTLCVDELFAPAASFLAGCSEWPLVGTPFLGAIGGRSALSSARGLRKYI